MTSSVYSAGTASVSNGSVIVIGDGTAWKLALVTGGMFSFAGLSVPIASVESDASLTLAYAWPGTTASGGYAIARETSEAVRAAWINDRLAQVLTKLALIGIHPDGAGTLAERNALSPVPPAGYMWLRVETGFDLVFYKRTASGWDGPFDTRGEAGQPGPAGVLNWIEAGWATATAYAFNAGLTHNGTSYRCYVAHTSGATTQPGAGANWATVWKVTAERGGVGPKGDQGNQGIQGNTGLTGAKGDKGDKGADGSGTGDMTKTVYDPTNKNGNAFAMANMVEGADAKVMTAAERDKLASIAAGAQVNTVTSVAGKSGAVALAKGDVGLGNVDNTSDANKPVSTAQQTALNGKVARAGDTLTGPLVLAGEPTDPLHAATKAYVDASGGAGVGVGQTWQDVSASRVAGTSYQNTTGKPIMVSVRLSTNPNYDFEVSSNGSTWRKVVSSTSTIASPAAVIVPHGHYYRVLTGYIANTWSELR